MLILGTKPNSLVGGKLGILLKILFKHHLFISEIVMSETELRNALDKTVDAVVRKLDKKTFMEAMPKVCYTIFFIPLHVLFLADH